MDKSYTHYSENSGHANDIRLMREMLIRNRWFLEEEIKTWIGEVSSMLIAKSSSDRIRHE